MLFRINRDDNFCVQSQAITALNIERLGEIQMALKALIKWINLAIHEERLCIRSLFLNHFLNITFHRFYYKHNPQFFFFVML